MSYGNVGCKFSCFHAYTCLVRDTEVEALRALTGALRMAPESCRSCSSAIGWPLKVRSRSMYSPFPRPTHTSPDNISRSRDVALCCSRSMHCCCGEIVIKVLSQSSRLAADVERTARPSSIDSCMLSSHKGTTLATARYKLLAVELTRVWQIVVRRYPADASLAGEAQTLFPPKLELNNKPATHHEARNQGCAAAHHPDPARQLHSAACGHGSNDATELQL